MPATKPDAEIKTAAEVRDEEENEYPELVRKTAARTGFHPRELVHSKFTNERTGAITEVVYPTFGARLRRFKEEHEDYEHALDEHKGIYIRTKFIEKTNPALFVVCEAEIRTKRGIFQDVGSASATRDKRLTKTLMEVAHTRAVNRALRLAGYGVEFDDEEGVLMNEAALPDPEPSQRAIGAAAAAAEGVPQSVEARAGVPEMTAEERADVAKRQDKLQKCATCGKSVSPGMAQTAITNFGKPYCFSHMPSQEA